jgi:3-oxoacyl-[acyl-carrier protein] reductase
MTKIPTKTAIVTGASRGIGSVVARRLAQDGFAIVVNYAGGEAEASALVKKIKADEGRAISAQADVSKPVEVARLFDAAEKEFGGVDVLVNNAGLMTLSSIATTDDATFDRLVAVNLKGTFNGLREAAKRLRTGGRIINFSTSVIGLKLETYGIYAATKSAIETLTAILSKELRGRSITVNAIAPGPTATDLFLNGKSPELIDRFAKMNPLERLGTPQDIAAAVAFLAGPDGSWINGQVLRANGGCFGCRSNLALRVLSAKAPVNDVADRIRAELLRNIGLPDLLTPRDLAAESQTAA